MYSRREEKQKRYKESVSMGICSTHRKERVLPGQKSCGKCKENRQKALAKAFANGICVRHRREGRLAVPGKTLCQECLWRTTDAALIRDFGVTPEIYAWMEYKQNRNCAICDRRCPSGKALAVDHDHETGKVRGLLCSHCNLFLGDLEQNKLLGKFSRYVKSPTIDLI